MCDDERIEREGGAKPEREEREGGGREGGMERGRGRERDTCTM